MVPDKLKRIGTNAFARILLVNLPDNIHKKGFYYLNHIDSLYTFPH